VTEEIQHATTHCYFSPEHKCWRVW